MVSFWSGGLKRSWVKGAKIFFLIYIKGILPKKTFYRPNLIFWIVMGCGRARFGQKGQKTPKIEHFGLG